MVLPLQDVQAAQQEDDPVRLRSNILALDRIQRNILHSLKVNDTGKKISSREKRETLIFVGYLKERNRHYCTQLAQKAGSAAIIDLPCPAHEIPVPRTKAKTTEEQIAQLDRQLDASLGEFDEMLLKEQERIAAHQPRQRESGGSVSSSGGAGGYGGQSGEQKKSSSTGAAGGQTSDKQQQPGQTPTAGRQRQNGRPATSGAAVAGSQGQAQTGSVAGPGGNRLYVDDDIVARQLREAAEKETDPELKEKLWQEYRKYKEGR